MQNKDFIGYEYTEVTVKQSVASMCVDGYENFGWALENTTQPTEKLDSVVLKFKRDRKNRSSLELTRLQQQFDSCLNDVSKMEASKGNKAMITAMVVAIIGTAFMAGSVFAIVGNMVVLGIILAVPAFIGWILPYLLYRRVFRQKTEQVAPLIDQKYEEIYTVCERASALAS